VKISVVTPNFNGANLLERAIKSVASQDYNDVEHIVMDGGSTDASLEIIARHSHKLTKVVSERITANTTPLGRVSRCRRARFSVG
jgi:glycosyltransferase involved in cell wall biosynthesis